MTRAPCVTNEQIASALSLADSTFRCFRLASAPALPFTRLPSATGRNIVRGYHVREVIEWLRRSTERCTPDVEAALYEAAKLNA
jgi:hypothetical protein